MKLAKLEAPFDKDYVKGYLGMTGDGRRFVRLANENSSKRKTLLYSRYLMSVKLGRYLDPEEHVDHIDNDKTNDSLDNLQILTKEQNYRKYLATKAPLAHGTSSMYRKGCRCELCRKWKHEHQMPYTGNPKKPIHKICLACGKEFSVISGHKNQKYCCRSCADQNRHKGG